MFPGQIFNNSNREPPRSKSFISSVAIHLTAVALLVFVVPRFAERESGRKVYIPSDNRVIYLPIFNRPDPSGGGGGGGERAPLPASKGKLPKFSLEQFVPPQKVENIKPKLVEDPTLVGLPEIEIKSPDSTQLGDLIGLVGPPSSGPGSGGGTGTGQGGGSGPGSGSGVGPGSGGGFGDGAFRFGGGVSAPQPLFKVNPEYSEEARKAKHQGVVELYIEVEADGTVLRVIVRKSLGLGLDEKAVEAIKKWKFKPGLKNGRPVITDALVTVQFRLL